MNTDVTQISNNKKVHVNMTIDADIVEHIDAERGLVPRSAIINSMLRELL
jgi:hypothetical protein